MQILGIDIPETHARLTAFPLPVLKMREPDDLPGCPDRLLQVRDLDLDVQEIAAPQIFFGHDPDPPAADIF